MPKTIYIPKDAKNSGVDITWIPSSQCLRIGGWYDLCVGIKEESMTLNEFFRRLGITQKDCMKAFKISNTRVQLTGKPSG